MKLLTKMIIAVIILIVILVFALFLFMQLPVFGADPSGARLDKIKQSLHYKEGIFHNQSPTEVMRKDASYIGMIRELLNKPKDTEPPVSLPSLKTDLNALAAEKPAIVWFGHSSYLIKSGGVSILVDPVLSGNASPVSFYGKSYPGSDVYKVEDLPSIDICILTHDHYDHLDYKTILQLKSRVKTFYTALGVGAHLERWGISPGNIVELDWWESHKVNNAIKITATPAKHFSGRGFTRAKAFWASYALQIHGYHIFIGGDSGYDAHFKAIGEKFGYFDIAMLECGQYGRDWPLIHMFPEETALAATELNTKVLMPVHWAKFSLAMHPWNEPIKRLLQSASERHLKVTTPLIGEPVILDSLYPDKIWWNL